MLKKASIFCLLTFTCLLLSFCERHKDIAAWVEDAPITISEMNYWMLLNKAEVYRHFYVTYGVNDSDEFWESKCGEESPLKMLRNLALQAAKRSKVQQLLALEKAIATEVNFDEMMSDMQKVNKERADKVARREVIYGPKQFTARTYYSYQHDKMVFELKEKLVEKELKPTREDLELLKPNPKVSVDDNFGFLKMQYVDENYDAFIDTRTKAATVKLNTKIFNEITL